MDKFLLNTTILKLVQITKNNYFDELITIAKTDSNFRDSILELVLVLDVMNCPEFHTKPKHNKFDMDFCESLNEDELIALIKTFTILDESIDEFSFKEQSPVKWLTLLLDKFKIDEDKMNNLCDWIFKNRKNPHIIPDHLANRDVKSLREHRLQEQLVLLRRQKYAIENNIKGIENQLKNPHKVTEDLIDAIKRKDINSINRLIEKGAELYLTDEHGVTLRQRVNDLFREKYKE